MDSQEKDGGDVLRETLYLPVEGDHVPRQTQTVIFLCQYCGFDSFSIILVHTEPATRLNQEENDLAVRNHQETVTYKNCTVKSSQGHHLTDSCIGLNSDIDNLSNGQADESVEVPSDGRVKAVDEPSDGIDPEKGFSTDKQTEELTTSLPEFISKWLPPDVEVLLKKPKNVDWLAQQCQLPVIVGSGGVTCYSGLCAVLRRIVKKGHEKHPQKKLDALLGFKQSCLKKCSEVSPWTKLCEVDIYQDLRVNGAIPSAILELEKHLASPLIISSKYLGKKKLKECWVIQQGNKMQSVKNQESIVPETNFFHTSIMHIVDKRQIRAAKYVYKKQLLQHKDASSEVQDAPSEVQDASSELQDASSEVQDACSEVQDASSEVQDACIEVNDASSEVQDASSEVQDASSEVHDACIEVNDASSEVQDASSEVQDASSEVQDACSEVQDASSEVQDACSEVQDASSEVQDASSEVRDASSEVQDASSEVQDVSSEVQDASSEVQDASSEVQDASSEVQDASSEVQDASSEVQGASSEVQDGSSEVQDASSEVQDASSEVQDASSEVHDAGNETHHDHNETAGPDISTVQRRSSASSCSKQPTTQESFSAHPKRLFAEGPYVTLADFALFYSLHSYHQSCMEEGKGHNLAGNIPLVCRWYQRMWSVPNVRGCAERCGLKEVVISEELMQNGCTTEVKTEVQTAVTAEVPTCNTNQDRMKLVRISQLPSVKDRVAEILGKLEGCGIKIDVDDFPCENIQLPWESFPADVNPSKDVSADRARNKRQQIECLVAAVKMVAKPGDVIVDFCSGGGHVGIVLAHCLPDCRVIMVENNEESVKRAEARIQGTRLHNMSFCQSNLDYFNGRFDMGVSLHACGVATDLVLEKCLKCRASFVCSPCCYGSARDSHLIKYPRSQRFLNSPLTYEDHLLVGHVAEQTSGNFETEMAKQAKVCMSILDTDRAEAARERGYRVSLCTLVPPTCSPKNNLLVGTPSPGQNAMI